MREKTKKSFDDISDIFTGEDGGVSFIKLKQFVEEFDKKAANGDEAARQIIDIVTNFSKLVFVAINTYDEEG